MRLPPILLLLSTVCLFSVTGACGAKTPIESERAALGAYCPTSPVDGQACPFSQDGCTFFFTDYDRGCVTASTCKCVNGVTTQCAPIGVCSTGGGDPLDRCAPGLHCGGTTFGCVVESCGRACTCGPDGLWQCGADSC